MLLLMPFLLTLALMIINCGRKKSHGRCGCRCHERCGAVPGSNVPQGQPPQPQGANQPRVNNPMPQQPRPQPQQPRPQPQQPRPQPQQPRPQPQQQPPPPQDFAPPDRAGFADSHDKNYQTLNPAGPDVFN